MPLIATKHRLEMAPGDSMGPVMGEITLRLSDGTSMTMKAEPLHVERAHSTSTADEYRAIYQQEEKIWMRTPDASQSSCVTISHFRRG
jgi:hypothetical protein